LEAVEPAKEIDEFPGGHAVLKGGVRRQKADVLANLAGLSLPLVARERGGAAGGLQDGAEDAHRGGLARAVGAEQAEDFAGMSVKTEVIHRAPFAGGEA